MVDDACILNLAIAQLNPRCEDLTGELLHAIPANLPQHATPHHTLAVQVPPHA